MDVREHLDTGLSNGAAGAVARGDWTAALDYLECTQSERERSNEELDLLAQAAYGAGKLELALTSLEKLHVRHAAAGRRLEAADAATRIAIYLMMDTGLMAPVRGWLNRAERLLEGAAEGPVHAWLAMVHTYERVMSGDMDAARPWAERAIDIGTRHGAPAPAAIGRVAAARLVIFDGRVDEGLRMLDEAAVATVSGELDALSVGIVYCELICAMQGLAQYDMAEEWTDAMERWRHGQAFGGINGRCRVHRAEILRLKGSCDEAEEEALHACAELRPWMRREFGWPLTELGVIRLRKGDLAGAEEAFLAAHEHGWDPQPGLALLHLEKGDVAGASALIRSALDHPLNVPSKERPPHVALRRAPLLEAQAEIAVAEDDLATARQAALELADIAATFKSAALAASASLAHGRVALAARDAVAAVAACEEAVAAWSDVGAPYETAVARLQLAAAHHAAGNADRAALERRAARSTLERIGGVHRANIGGSAADPGAARSENGTRTAHHLDLAPPATSVFRLEGDTRTVVYNGHTVLLRDLKGMRYLARLLASPGREFHVLDIVATEQGSGVVVDSDAGVALDTEAKEAYRRRLVEIEEDLDEAARIGDAERAVLAEADRDYLVRELARAFGLGGRSRDAGSTSERARASVTRALRYALVRVADHHPALAAHLEQSVRTGTYCAYVPDPGLAISWEI
jgi:hypothetical protein